MIKARESSKAVKITDWDLAELRKAVAVTPRVTPVTKAVTLNTTALIMKGLIAGKPCPLCGCKVPRRETPAQKQKAYRARRKVAG